MKFNVTRVGLALGLALGLAAAIAASGPARAAGASPALCQTQIATLEKTLEGQILAALVSCSDTLRTDATSIAKAGPPCFKALQAVYKPGGDVDKFRTKMEALVPAKCTANTLTALGFLLSGAGNPAPPIGGTVIKFTEDYLALKAEQDAYSEVMAQSPLFANLFLQLQDDPSVNCTTITAANNYICLARSECMERTCALGSNTSSNSYTYVMSETLGGLAGKLTGGNIMGMCNVDGNLTLPTGLTEPGVMYITGNQGRQLGIVTLGGIHVCVDTLRAAGYCDCNAGGGAGLKDIDQCMDRDIYVNCPKGLLDTGLDKCGADCSAAQADPNYPPDYNGLPVIVASGSTIQGDCVDQITNQFTVVTGGEDGPDGVPCTEDDEGDVDTPTTVVLTTGTSRSELWDAVHPRSPTDAGFGTCPTSGDLCVGACLNSCVSKHCSEVSPLDPATCSGSGLGNCPQNVCGTGTGTPVNYDTTEPWYTVACVGGTNDGLGCRSNADCPSGACTSGGYLKGKLPPTGGAYPYSETNVCSLYLQDHLTGMRLVGSFPGSSSAASGGLGDDLSFFNQDCQ